ncbi:vacuolar fusion protein MON1 homolog A-like [Elysia marginata]|uniref:Vacuolar fusion protein MON1 homolog n=1 Tax=Elysia marginata TaxID=1093978 RepID=A0AAV4FKH2_9GAST|nr:vacuolar fusion protein MON1 homolog A-like [Elysia marginata]
MATDHREAEQPAIKTSDSDNLQEEAEFVETNDVPGKCNSAVFDTTDELDDLNLNLANGVIQNHRGTITSLIRRRSKRSNTLRDEETDPDLVNSNASEEANSIEQSELSSELSDDENLKNGLEGLSLQDTESVPEESPSVALTPSSSETDYVNSLEWKQQKKHIFILSESGKPIYSRHGSEDKLVTIMGVMQALVSFVQDDKDNLRSIVAGDHTFVFMNRDHLTFVGVTRGRESTQQMLLQLTYMYNQVISVLTHNTLVRTFKAHRNFDLRRPLSGAEKFFDNLLNLMDVEPGLLLTSVRCLPLDSSVREIVSQTIVQHAKVKDLVFALIIAQNQLVALVRMKRYYLHPMDLHLIINLINASESFKAAESWTPICLPKFDATGFLQAYVSYLDEDCQSCLLLLSVDIEAFYTLSECRAKIKERLVRYNALTAISNSLQRHSYSVQQCSIGDLRHFLYKARSTAQYTSPELGPPYNTPEQQDRLFGLYHFLHDKVHSSSRPLKLLYHVGKYETLLGWVTQGFELYAVFGPLVTKNVAIHAVNKLLRWIKREEDRLFILSSVTF